MLIVIAKNMNVLYICNNIYIPISLIHVTRTIKNKKQRKEIDIRINAKHYKEKTVKRNTTPSEEGTFLLRLCDRRSEKYIGFEFIKFVGFGWL